MKRYYFLLNAKDAGSVYDWFTTTEFKSKAAVKRAVSSETVRVVKVLTEEEMSMEMGNGWMRRAHTWKGTWAFA